MASAGTCISLRRNGPAATPNNVSGRLAAYRKNTAVCASLRSRSASEAPAACEIRMDIPEPMPRKIHKRISSGWELVATAAKADASQKLPITKVSTVPYNCCKIFPMQIGNANCAARPKIEPCVISILLIFIDNHPLCKNGKYLNCRM